MFLYILYIYVLVQRYIAHYNLKYLCHKTNFRRKKTTILKSESTPKITEKVFIQFEGKIHDCISKGAETKII